VDRLTTGRRHVRAGSVSVTELITKQAAPEPAKAELKPAREPELVTVDPVAAGPTSHRRPVARGVQLAKMTSLAVATIVLCGAVGVASTIAQERAEERGEQSGTTDRPVEQINGEQALLPDELNRSLTPTGAKAAAPPRPAPATQRRATAPAAPRTATPTPAPPAKPAVAPVSDAQLVRQFYDVLPRDPTVAFDLLSPDLLHSTLGQFLESWSHVRSVKLIDLREQANGVLTVVQLRLADGGQLRLQQLLTVADSPRRITGVELLSAQRN